MFVGLSQLNRLDARRLADMIEHEKADFTIGAFHEASIVSHVLISTSPYCDDLSVCFYLKEVRHTLPLQLLLRSQVRKENRIS